MSLPETQLRAYFDAGVERITAEDVIAGSRVAERGMEPLRSSRNLKPAWAGVAAFAVTLVGLGGLASVLRFAPQLTGQTGTGGIEIVEAGDGTIGVWLIAAVVAAIAAAMSVWLVRRSSARAQHRYDEELDQGGVMVMETIERTDVESQESKKTAHRGRWPIVLIVLLALAVVGLVAWMAFGMRPNSPNAAPPEITQLIDDYTAAWNAYDGEALEALVSPYYEVSSGPGMNDLDLDLEGVQSSLYPEIESWGWHITHEGPYYAVAGDEPGSWLVSLEGSVVTRDETDHNQMSVLKVIASPEGKLLVRKHLFVGG